MGFYKDEIGPSNIECKIAVSSLIERPPSGYRQVAAKCRLVAQ